MRAAVGALSVVCFASSYTFDRLPTHHVGNRLKFDQHDRRAKGNRNSATVYLDNVQLFSMRKQ